MDSGVGKRRWNVADRLWRNVGETVKYIIIFSFYGEVFTRNQKNPNVLIIIRIYQTQDATVHVTL